MAKALIVEILAETGQFGRELDRAAGKTRQFGSVAKVAGLALAGGLALGIEKSFAAGEKLKVAQDSLTTAIKHTGGNVDVLTGQYTKTAQAAAQFGVNQTDATTALARSTELTGNAAAAQRAYQEALVISKATGKDFNAVLTATAKGQEGITTSLQRYGIEVAKGTPGVKQYTDVMGRFGGQAAANTTATQQLSANFQNLTANLGTLLIPVVNKVASVLTALTGFLQKHMTLTKVLIGVVAGLTAGLLALSAATWAVNVAMDANPIGIVIVALAALGTALVIAWEKSRTFRNVVIGAWNDIKSTTSAVFDFVKSVITGTINGAITAFKDVKSFATHLWDGIKKIWDATIGAEIRSIISLVKTLISWFEKAFGWIGKVASAAGKVHVPGGSVGSGIVNGAANAVTGGLWGVVTGHAAGGIVTSPQIGMIGEAGPEAIIPLSSPRARGMMGGANVTLAPGSVVINGTADAAFARILGQELATQLRGGRIPALQQAIHAI